MSACRLNINAGCKVHNHQGEEHRPVPAAEAAGRLETPFCNICKAQLSDCAQPEAARYSHYDLSRHSSSRVHTAGCIAMCNVLSIEAVIEVAKCMKAVAV